ncbi:MAG TPA: head-tail connector protein [Candidatus Saccharicenans sp.]|nr:head-tail connector protein [Candidatus Saccharicenans sp.]
MAVISLEEAKLYLKVDTTDDDELINALISVAERLVEKYTGRTLLTSEFVFKLDDPPGEILIPHSPLQSVSKIEVIDDSGVATEVAASNYYVDIDQAQQGRVRLRPGCVWPYHRGFASFVISGSAGYGDSPDKVPTPLKTAILLALAILYENRGQVESQTLIDSISALCWPYRVLRI